MMIEAFKTIATSCSGSSFFGLPTWYTYLPGKIVAHQCVPQFTSLSDTWLVVAAIIEILLRLAAIIAVAMVIIGGVTYTTSQGNPENTAKARNTIMYALAGLLLAISAAVLVSFMAKSLGA
jgi:ABC-type Fe3+ transport system permease subunit